MSDTDCLLITGYGPPPPTASPGPGKARGRVPPGPATPQQTHQLAYPDPRASPQIARPTPPGQALVRERPGNMLVNWNPEDLPPSHKREGQDWYAVFNPDVQRVLDVDLVHHLVHDSVVCCVRFSRDGKYLATGCNRSAQIFDVDTGHNVATLQDETVDKDGDLYIRSVCFSPDGKFLATGAEDKQIRVRFLGRLWRLLLTARCIRFGTLHLGPSNISSPVTSKTFTPWTLPQTAGTSPRAAATKPCGSGISWIAGMSSYSVLRMVSPPSPCPPTAITLLQGR